MFNRFFKGDKVIWAVIGVLLIFSVLAVYSSTGTLAYKYMSGNTTYYLLRHSKFLLLGVLVVYIIHRIPYLYFSRLSQILVVISIPLLVFTLLFGVTRNEASRWLTLPGLGIEFQTSDLAKFALIMFIARLLGQNQNNDVKLELAFKPMIIVTATICGLILLENLSTAILLFATAWVLMFIGRVRLLLLVRVLGSILVFIAALVILSFAAPNIGRLGTWKNRIVSFVKDDGTNNHQVDQAKIAIVTGGFIGKGPGNSDQRNFLPHPYSDFIFAIIIEEYGSLGGMIVLMLYLFLLYRTGVIVRQSSKTFQAFLAIGLTLNLVLQALTNMAVAVNLIPVTGQTLPLVSMGGTSILFNSVALGIILSVSRSIEQEKMQGVGA